MLYHIDRKETSISKDIATCVHAAFTAHTAFTHSGNKALPVLEHFWPECFSTRINRILKVQGAPPPTTCGVMHGTGNRKEAFTEGKGRVAGVRLPGA